MTDASEVAEARRWFRRLGHVPIDLGSVSIVADAAHPEVWDANFAVAGDGAAVTDLLTGMDRHLTHTLWRVVVADCLTPVEVEAALPLAGFTQRRLFVEMLAPRPVVSDHPPAKVELRRIRQAADWTAHADLARIDHYEGERTGPVSDEVNAGLLAVMQRCSPPCDHWLLIEDGDAVGYGTTVACPGGLGLIENLFTRPDRRRRGLMSAFIAAAVSRLRAAGCHGVFLDALAEAAPQRLYAKLGFAPVALVRTWAHNGVFPS